MFLDKIKQAPMAGTFNDYILLPGLADLEPSNIDVSTRLTDNIELTTPFISSPMDTVSGSELAIALARLGGLGILHRNCSIEEEVEDARKVKRAESFIIRDVVSISPDQNVEEATDIMHKKNISGLPVIKDGKLSGIITKRDVTFATSSRFVKEVMTDNVIIAREDVSVKEAKKLMSENKIEKLPIVNKKDTLTGLITIKDLFLREKYPYGTRDEDGRLMVGAAVSPFDIKRAKVLEKHVDLLVIDVAHFHNKNVIESTKKLIKETDIEIIVGNIGTKEAMTDIITNLEGISGVRVGVGSGSICTTSDVTKAGSPTLYATCLVSEAIYENKSKISVISDGGIRHSGHAALAFSLGASAVMMGNVFARCKESLGELVTIGDRYYKKYRGMGSIEARQKRFTLDRYNTPSKELAEGVEGLVPYTGDTEQVVNRLVSGLKASMGYAGASSISDMWNKTKLARVSQLGGQELKPHNILLPNQNEKTEI